MSLEKHASVPISPTELRNKPRRRGSSQALFGRFADSVTRWTGSPAAFFIAVVLLLVWALCGPWFDYSETWQLVVNTGTTIVTFLMVFVIQQSQNKDSHAVHLKLDELLSATKTADNALIDAEHLDAEDLDSIARRYARLAHQRRTSKADEQGHRRRTSKADEQGHQRRTSEPDEQGRKSGVENMPERLGRRRDRLAKGLTGFTSQQRTSRLEKTSRAKARRKSAGARSGNGGKRPSRQDPS